MSDPGSSPRSGSDSCLKWRSTPAVIFNSDCDKYIKANKQTDKHTSCIPCEQYVPAMVCYMFIVFGVEILSPSSRFI